ncbi:dienelactone hydrolase family protein [Corynebacterium uterequi]|uniref:dienelactone hydrolase family protein n=1 Tax=Corynebacterium uterequi TaxID=1072256 RepID=UPI0006415F29|nr:dienelactone hydrolase family protein [Corynebacterium uterequi]
MSPNLNKPLSKLSKRGPHRVLVGDLAYAGIEGKVYTPAEGDGLPAVAFGHDWLKSVKNYHATLRHLASWGIVVGAPDTERGFSPDHAGFAADLDSTLQILAGVKLGHGNATVNPGRLGVVGHGMGGGAAVLTAANNDRVKAVAALFPAVVTPSAYDAAPAVDAPGLIIGSQKGELFGAGNPAKLAHHFGSDVVFREVDGMNQQGFTEDTLVKLTVGIGLPQTAGQERVRGLLTGFLLHQLAQDNSYANFSDPDASAKKVVSYTRDELAERIA